MAVSVSGILSGQRRYWRQCDRRKHRNILLILGLSAAWWRLSGGLPEQLVAPGLPVMLAAACWLLLAWNGSIVDWTAACLLAFLLL